MQIWNKKKKKKKAVTLQHHKINPLGCLLVKQQEYDRSSHTECTCSHKIVQIETYTKKNVTNVFYPNEKCKERKEVSSQDLKTPTTAISYRHRDIVTFVQVGPFTLSIIVLWYLFIIPSFLNDNNNNNKIQTLNTFKYQIMRNVSFHIP